MDINKILLGDCKEKLKELPENSVDAVITDPPYELGFMGKSWDKTGIANNVEMWAECLRVLKPGGHLLSFSGTRTYHRMAVAIEDAGFEVRDMIEWVYGSGFPKSLNIGKTMDKYLKTGNASWNGTGDSSNGALGYSKLQHQQGYRPADYSNKHQNKSEITENKAKEWSGWGTALKPAHEPICMARKPLAEKTVAENCLKWGTGGINIDESRVGTEDKLSIGSNKHEGNTINFGMKDNKEAQGQSPLGRFPANIIHDNSEEVRECFPETKSGKAEIGMGNDIPQQIYGKYAHKRITSNFADSGNTSRFFKSIIYTAKASKSERGNGNNHPTVKPVALMEYLIKMVTKEGQTVLDMFMGSGSTGVACANLNRTFIGIEISDEYLEIAKYRIKKALETPQQIMI